MTARVVGAGLAGCEAAWQLARRGIRVTLYEMKPERMSPAHHSPDYAELVCSNSLRSDQLSNAVGLLKAELRALDSLILREADAARVPAGGALAVDREAFARGVTRAIRQEPLITVERREVTRMPDAPVIVATGPLTSDALAEALLAMPEVRALHFYDAAAPIVMADSIRMDSVFRASRYGRGDDYLNCPMTRGQYDAFVSALVSAQTVPVHGFEESAVFEGCMPVESMAKRGDMALAFGPLKPVGLRDPATGREPFAVVQLRQDDAAGQMYNIVGFQTRLMHPEQRRVFGLIPGLERAEFARYGAMHRNTFLNSPDMLDDTFQMRARPGVYFAGQITGVEGYVESAASGFVAGVSLALRLLGKEMPRLGRKTAIGSLGNYVSAMNRAFQPMNVTFGLMDMGGLPGKGKERGEAAAARALERVWSLREDLLCQEEKRL